jgi:HlyD family type I secretion membrane fusion protein
MLSESNSQVELMPPTVSPEIDRAEDSSAFLAFEPERPVQPAVQVNEFLPSVSNWLVFGGIAVVVALGVAIPVSAFLKYKTTVQAQATVRPAGELRLVQASTAGKIQEIRVKQGQTVKKGQVIATIDNSSLLTKQNQLLNRIKQQRLQLTQFNAQIGTFDSQITAESARHQATISAAEAELAGTRRNYQDKQTKSVTELAEVQAKFRSTAAALESAKEKAERYRLAKPEGAISKNQVAEVELAFKQQEQEFLANKASLQRGRAALNPNAAEVSIAQRRIAQEQNAGRATLANLDREKKALLQQQIEAKKQFEQDLLELQQVKVELQQIMITATSDGIISQLNLRNSDQTVQPREEIAQIVPSNTPLEIKAAVVPADMGKLKKGQSVQMRLSACSYTDYGTFKGAVSRISQDTIKVPANDPASNSLAGASKSPAFYEVTVLPESQTIGKGKNQCSLQLGMEGRVDIVTEEESVLKFLLRKARLLVDK